MAKVTGWATILLLYAIMLFMLVMGLEVTNALRGAQPKLAMTIIIVVTWVVGGFITYAIYETMQEPR